MRTVKQHIKTCFAILSAMVLMARGGFAQGADAGAGLTIGTGAGLAFQLATNLAVHTNGVENLYGIYGGTMALANWQYRGYSGTNLYWLTNAVWSKHFWLKDVQGLSATCIGFSNGLGGQGLMTMVSPRHYLCATCIRRVI
jgi:hypothetical protein